MKSTKPYLFEALYKCITDSDLTPLMLARSDILGVKLPKGFDQDQTIVLDLSYDAITDLVINNRYIAFEAIFDEKYSNIFVYTMLGCLARKSPFCTLLGGYLNHLILI